MESGERAGRRKNKKNIKKHRENLHISEYLATFALAKQRQAPFNIIKRTNNGLLRYNRALSSVGSERLPYKQRVGGSNPSAPTRGVSRDLFGGCGNFFCYSPCPVFSAKLCRTLHPRIRNASHQCPLDINGWRHFICTKLRAQCQAGARRSNVMRMSRLAV